MLCPLVGLVSAYPPKSPNSKLFKIQFIRTSNPQIESWASQRAAYKQQVQEALAWLELNHGTDFDVQVLADTPRHYISKEAFWNWWLTHLDYGPHNLPDNDVNRMIYIIDGTILEWVPGEDFFYPTYFERGGWSSKLGAAAGNFLMDRYSLVMFTNCLEPGGYPNDFFRLNYNGFETIVKHEVTHLHGLDHCWLCWLPGIDCYMGKYPDYGTIKSFNPPIDNLCWSCTSWVGNWVLYQPPFWD